MIIMTDNKNETNQNQRDVRERSRVSIFDGQPANLALSTEAFRGL